MIPKSAEAVQALIMRGGIVVNVTRGDRLRLEAIVADRCAPQKHVWRANVILATADGCGAKGRTILKRAGVVDYFCRFHPGMQGRLEVAP